MYIQYWISIYVGASLSYFMVINQQSGWLLAGWLVCLFFTFNIKHSLKRSLRSVRNLRASCFRTEMSVTGKRGVGIPIILLHDAEGASVHYYNSSVMQSSLVFYFVNPPSPLCVHFICDFLLTESTASI